MAKDQIYERYLTRAIAEINELGDDIARCSDDATTSHRPVLGSGHPLADIFLLKFAPTAAEVAEGVAFYGRVGQAVLKSMQRLGVDPLLVYGTNCVKCVHDGDEPAAPADDWLLRELAIVQPKIVIVMGEQALDVLNELDLPLRRQLEMTPGAVQSLTPTIEAIYAPAIEHSLDEQAAKRRFWGAFRSLGDWYAALPPY